jgi:hypothetical protein
MDSNAPAELIPDSVVAWITIHYSFFHVHPPNGDFLKQQLE